ncbi:MAG: hypothetical protein KBG28_25610 [Kofleriaceae bacterium]|nr:hypothetical protein [Kofleriaceae bacterium]MBP6840587.1 hypothetical protein [Kofleriaceae bacterium]MBP9207373.1 hypothetical protein [Kofleriaceae bacterium]
MRHARRRPVFARGVLALAAAVAACTGEQAVLFQDAGVVTSCAQAFTPMPGDRCLLAAPCTQPSPTDPTCCTDFAYCTDGVLARDTVCDPSCATPCMTDRECPFGSATCDGTRCVACTPPGPNGCDPCPPGWEPLQRNGCPTCECAPARECDPMQGCPNDPMTPQCYTSQSCAAGCAPGDPTCCTNVCAAPGCPEPAPVGCFMTCDPQTMCGLCAADDCDCVGGRWTCTPVCVDRLTTTCQAP